MSLALALDTSGVARDLHKIPAGLDTPMREKIGKVGRPLVVLEISKLPSEETEPKPMSGNNSNNNPTTPAVVGRVSHVAFGHF